MAEQRAPDDGRLPGAFFHANEPRGQRRAKCCAVAQTLPALHVCGAGGCLRRFLGQTGRKVQYLVRADDTSGLEMSSRFGGANRLTVKERMTEGFVAKGLQILVDGSSLRPRVCSRARTCFVCGF